MIMNGASKQEDATGPKEPLSIDIHIHCGMSRLQGITCARHCLCLGTQKQAIDMARYTKQVRTPVLATGSSPRQQSLSCLVSRHTRKERHKHVELITSFANLGQRSNCLGAGGDEC